MNIKLYSYLVKNMNIYSLVKFDYLVKDLFENKMINLRERSFGRNKN